MIVNRSDVLRNMETRRAMADSLNELLVKVEEAKNELNEYIKQRESLILDISNLEKKKNEAIQTTIEKESMFEILDRTIFEKRQQIERLSALINEYNNNFEAIKSQIWQTEKDKEQANDLLDNVLSEISKNSSKLSTEREKIVKKYEELSVLDKEISLKQQILDDIENKSKQKNIEIKSKEDIIEEKLRGIEIKEKYLANLARRLRDYYKEQGLEINID